MFSTFFITCGKVYSHYPSVQPFENNIKDPLSKPAPLTPKILDECKYIIQGFIYNQLCTSIGLDRKK